MRLCVRVLCSVNVFVCDEGKGGDLLPALCVCVRVCVVHTSAEWVGQGSPCIVYMRNNLNSNMYHVKS